MDNPEKAAAAVDPTRHVNYTHGMVLGVDDFTQEFAYHSHRDRWAARDLAGYGTLAGLRVTARENKSGDPEVVVTAGTALSPSGQLIRVPREQSANVNGWLASAENRAAVAALVGEPPAAPLALYVVLRYRECPTDNVPAFGDPHGGEEGAAVPSRLKDDFLLELRPGAPRQAEEDAARDFVRWLAEHAEFTDEPGAFAGLEEFLARLRDASGAISSPPADPAPPPDYMRGSSPEVMRVEAARRGEYLRAAFRLWATELRPRCRPAHFDEPCECPAGAHDGGHAVGGDDDCVLLAELSVPLTADLQVDKASGVEVREGRRPYLLHQRMIQEWLLEGACCARASRPSPPALTDLADVSAPSPREGDVLTFSGGRWVAARPPAASGEAADDGGRVLSTRGGVRLTLDDGAGGQGRVILETPGGQKLTLKDGPGAVEIADSHGNSIRLEAAGVTVTAAANVTINANTVRVSAGLLTVDAGAARFSGVVQCDTLISNSVVSASYTPGAGNVL